VSNETPKLTKAQRAADVVTEFCGSWTFIIAFSLITLGWMALNSILILFRVFDPYPLIMMSQNRQMERDRDAVQGLHEKLDDLASQLKGHAQ